MHFYHADSRRDGNLDTYKTQQNFQTLQEYVQFSHDNYWIPAEDFVDISGTTTLTFRNSSPVRVFENTVTSSAGVVIRRPRMWLDGVATIRIWYTDDGTASGFNHAVGVSVARSLEGSAIASHSYTSLSVPCVSAAGVLEIDRQSEVNTSDNCSRPVDQSYDLITVGIQYTGNDEGAIPAFELIGIELFYRGLNIQHGMRGTQRAQTSGRYVARA